MGFLRELTDGRYTSADLAGMIIGLTVIVVALVVAALVYIEYLTRREEEHYEALKMQNDRALLNLIQGKAPFTLPRKPYDWKNECD